jgi:hypothetical protein
MYREAYHALEAIRLEQFGRLEGRDRWVKAFKACRWAVQTERGLALTDAGTAACQDFAKRYRGKLAA